MSHEGGPSYERMATGEVGVLQNACQGGYNE